MWWSIGLFFVIVPAVVTYTCTVDPVDVVFVLDSSGSMGTSGFQLELDFVKQFTNLVQIGEEEFHIGVVQFNTQGFTEFSLTTYFDKTSIINAVQNIGYRNGGTSISSGLSTAKDVLDRTKRSSAVRYVVLLTDGDLSSDRDAALSIAENLKSDSALRIFIIGIGLAIPTDDMKQIASSPSYFLHVNQAAELAAVATRTVNITCRDIKDCANSPCQNGGTCETTQSGYTCKCPYGYIGVRCQDYDECISNPCFNNGTCHQGRDVYSCMCVPGYTGARCESNNDECSSNPCKNGATCIDMINGYNCHCVQGYVGANCEIVSYCGGHLTAETNTSTLSSPSYPSYYKNNLNCHWTIESPINYGIMINITDIYSEEKSDCLHDYLQIFLGINDPNKTYRICSNNTEDIALVTVSNQADIIYVTNGKLRFLLKYEAGTCYCEGESSNADCYIDLSEQHKNRFLLDNESCVETSNYIPNSKEAGLAILDVKVFIPSVAGFVLAITTALGIWFYCHKRRTRRNKERTKQETYTGLQSTRTAQDNNFYEIVELPDKSCQVHVNIQTSDSA